MITDHSGVQQILQSHADDMKHALQRQDMKIDSYQVFLQNNSDGNQQNTNQWTAMNDQSRERQPYHVSQGQEDSPEILLGSGDPGLQASSGLVSIFA
jgi:flagellar hook-length control protein FliK